MAKGLTRSATASDGMMQQIQRVQQQLAEAQAQLTLETVTASSGGGAVKVTMTGDQNCRSVEISPELLREADADIMQDPILSAVNLVLEQSRAPGGRASGAPRRGHAFLGRLACPSTQQFR